MGKFFPILVSISVLIIALSFAYYFVIFLPDKEKARQELEKQKGLEKIWQQTQLESCLEQADKAAADYWNKICEGKGLKKDCQLPVTTYNRVKEFKTGLRDDCFKQYPLD